MGIVLPKGLTPLPCIVETRCVHCETNDGEKAGIPTREQLGLPGLREGVRQN